MGREGEVEEEEEEGEEREMEERREVISIAVEAGVESAKPVCSSTYFHLATSKVDR